MPCSCSLELEPGDHRLERGAREALVLAEVEVLAGRERRAQRHPRRRCRRQSRTDSSVVTVAVSSATPPMRVISTSSGTRVLAHGDPPERMRDDRRRRRRRGPPCVTSGPAPAGRPVSQFARSASAVRRRAAASTSGSAGRSGSSPNVPSNGIETEKKKKLIFALPLTCQGSVPVSVIFRPTPAIVESPRLMAARPSISTMNPQRVRPFSLNLAEDRVDAEARLGGEPAGRRGHLELAPDLPGAGRDRGVQLKARARVVPRGQRDRDPPQRRQVRVCRDGKLRMEATGGEQESASSPPRMRTATSPLNAYGPSRESEIEASNSNDGRSKSITPANSARSTSSSKPLCGAVTSSRPRISSRVGSGDSRISASDSVASPRAPRTVATAVRSGTVPPPAGIRSRAC